MNKFWKILILVAVLAAIYFLFFAGKSTDNPLTKDRYFKTGEAKKYEGSRIKDNPGVLTRVPA